MPLSKRDLLATLSKPELLELGRTAALEVTGKMSKDDLLDQLAPGDRLDLAKTLPTLAYESLKSTCTALGLSLAAGESREKSSFVARLLAAVTPAGEPVPKAAPRAADDFTIELPVEPRKPRLAWQGMDRKEAVIAVPTQVVEIVRPGRARDQGDTLLKGDTKTYTRGTSERPGHGGSELPPNRLIWTNDNLVALQTLLDERDPETREYRYRAKVDLVYIDPPFMVNSDFRADNTIDIDIDEDEGVQAKKEPSLVEHLAYRDTWRQGLDSFLSMLKRRLELLKDLLAPTGSIYVHLDWHAVHYVKVLMDEIFGYENFRNEVVWKRSSIVAGVATQWRNAHDSLLFYSAGPDPYFDPQFGEYTEGSLDHYKFTDARGRYRLVPIMASGRTNGPTGQPWRGVDVASRGKNGMHWLRGPDDLERMDREGVLQWNSQGTPELKYYLHEAKGPYVADVWDTINPINSMGKESYQYPTQKPVELVERIVRATCPPGGLVLDCFMGSGTTAEAAERLGRRWIGIDNGKYAVHIARKRLIQLHGQPRPSEKSQFDYVECKTCSNLERKEKPQKSREFFAVRPFTAENMGVYQRAELWQDFQTQKSRYRDEMIKVFGGEPGGVGQFLHGRKEGQWVHVGPLDGAISTAQIWQLAREAARTDTKAVTVLSADFNTLDGATQDEIRAKTGVSITIRVIPTSAIDEVRRRIEMQRIAGERPVESMAIPAFYAPLSIVLNVAKIGRIARLTLDRCEIDIQSFLASQRPPLKPVLDGMSATARKKAEGERDKWASREKDLKKWLAKADSWQKFIDFWAIDWDYGHRVGADDKPIFETEWQSFRLRKSKSEVEALVFTAEFQYAEPGQYRIAARVTDVFGNDGIATVAIEVG